MEETIVGKAEVARELAPGCDDEQWFVLARKLERRLQSEVACRRAVNAYHDHGPSIGRPSAGTPPQRPAPRCGFAAIRVAAI